MTAESAGLAASPMSQYFYRASADDFKKVPGSPICYWSSENMLCQFSNKDKLSKYATPRIGMRTGDNNRFLRLWHEVSLERTGFDFISASEAKLSNRIWFPYNKGGPFRKWYGNNEYVVEWFNDGYAIKSNTLEKYPDLSWDNLGWKISNESLFFLPAITWTATSSSHFGVRQSDAGFLFDVKGSFCVPDGMPSTVVLGFMVSKLVRNFLTFLNPTIEFQPRDIGNLPISIDTLTKEQSDSVECVVATASALSKEDWDSYEVSWGFKSLPILHPRFCQSKTALTYESACEYWCQVTQKVQCLEQENNRIFIEAYGLGDELTPEVPIEEITLTCNPHYRYGGSKNDEELEALLLADTMREFCSYAVGCMFGRYSLDNPGLVLANQGETLADYLKQVPKPTFTPDEDNVIPILDGDWFPDDVTERFRKFLRITFGEEHYEENLAFVERGLNIKNKRNYSIRDFFVKEFYAYHVKLYKKRPIYWLFSSPKGSFNALIYMHRYRPDTVSVVLKYLRDYRDKLETEQKRQTAISDSGEAAQTDKTKAAKEVERLRRILTELEGYEREVLYPLATQRLEIDLDDGVKFNYPHFRPALKKVTGLEVQ